MSESEIQKSIINYLKVRRDYQHDLVFWRINTGAARLGGRVVNYGYVGMADIIGVLRGGRFMAIEVKAEKGKQSAEQKVWQETVTNTGGIYILARSVDDVIRGLGEGDQ